MLPSEILRRVRRIEIRTHRLVNDTLAGSYHSVFKGTGMEFSEVREYTPGDDVRSIDWNVTSRMGETYVKKHIEERELTVVLCVDASGSESFGSGSRLKREVASEIAALIAFAALKNNDRVGLLVFTEGIEKWVPPRKGLRHVLRVMREIVAHETVQRGTDIAQALTGLNRVLHKRAVVFLISDFLGTGYERALKTANRRHDVIAVTLTDPREEELPAIGLVRLEDAETGESVVLDSSDKKLRKRFADAALDRARRRKRHLRAARVDTIDIRTDAPYDKPLLKFFAERSVRIGR
jgi:uncharacterized protein (DUF58 family)